MTRTAEPRLQRTLLRWLLLPLLALLVVDLGFTYLSSRQLADLAHDRSLQEIARELRVHLALADGQPRFVLTAEAQRVLLEDPDDQVRFRVADAQGRLLGGEAALDGVVESAPGAGPPHFGDRLLDGRPVRVVDWVTTVGDTPATVRVTVAETVHKRERLARDILVRSVLPQLVLIGMATLAVWLGVSRGLAPLRGVTEAVSGRSHLDLSLIDVQGTPAEVRPLVAEVNQLMARLGTVLDYQSRFVADAAHQLKTPVSGLKAQIELALRESDPQRLKYSLAQLYVGAERLSHLVQQLLALARNEPSAARSVRRERIDLRQLAKATTMDWVPMAIKAGIDLGFEADDVPLMIDADVDRLRELINNLLDNAIRYSRPEGRATVAVRAAGAQVQLAVGDDGPHIPEAEKTRIFERFHRVLGTQTTGSGLGLAIVSEIATLHGARIELEADADGVGNRFCVLFPRAGFDSPGAGLSAG